MKNIWKSKLYILGTVVLILGSGCKGGYLFNSISDLLGCIFYGDCDNLDYGYLPLSFNPGDPDHGDIQLEAKWQHDDGAGEPYYILYFNEDRTLRLEKYERGRAEPVRTDNGVYLPAGDKLTISMDNGTRSVVRYKITGGRLQLSF